MKRIVTISILFHSLFLFGQTELSSEVNYLNHDSFFENDGLESNPILPVLSSPDKIGFSLPWVAKQERYKTNYLNVFPVVSALGSYQSDALSTSSVNTGVGFGITGQFSKKFYARLILTGNYTHREGSDELYSSIYQTGFWEDHQKNSIIGLQPRVRLSYSPYDFLNIQAGIDQNFIGQGKRSMLLGDYGAPYPFVQLRTKIWRIEVTNIYQAFKENQNSTFTRKFASTHFFNYKITKRLQVGIFESVVFSPKDTLLNRGYEVAYLNPFLFYRPTEYGIGSQDRLVIGLNTSYEFNRLMIYGQLAIDEFVLNELISRSRWWANKYSGQIGFKGKNELSFGKLRWLAELNFARPFIYSHLNVSTNYGNQGRPLAHPLGSNFAEVYTEASLAFSPRFSVKGKFFFVQQGGGDGNDTLSYGSDVYMPYTEKPFEYGYKIGGNGKVNRYHFSLEANYQLSKKLRIEAFVRPGIEINNQAAQGYQSHFIIYGGIRTNLWNDHSFDF
ncbi:MAG TPA: hypothetical protein VKX29_02185 [Brumimicrobium sp.]|nr:hypothetical protein [Brumimicrobium sp.]